VSEKGSDDDDNIKKEFFQLALQGCIVFSAMVGLFFFYRAFNNHEPIGQALEAFIPPIFFFALRLLHNFTNLLTKHELSTYVAIGTFTFSMYLAYRWINEVDPSRKEGWAALCTGILGFSLGIPFTKLTGRK
jgi:hypothetical protein